MNLDWAKFDPELPQHFNALLGPSRARQKLCLENPLDLKKIDSVGWIQLDGSVVVFINCRLCLILNDKKILHDSCDMISTTSHGRHDNTKVKVNVLNLAQKCNFYNMFLRYSRIKKERN